MADELKKCYDGHEAPVAECAACAENEAPSGVPETLGINVHEGIQSETGLA